MKKAYLVFKIDNFNGITEVAEADTLELCQGYLKSEKFRVVECWKKS